MQFAPNIERWRSKVAQYFAPEDIDRALWVIQYESSGNPGAISDSGGYGLMQLNDGGLGEGLTREQRLDPDINLRTAAAAVYGGQGWKPWGENNLYQGRVFGSLGNHPFPGGATNGRAMTAQRVSWAGGPVTGGFGPTDETRDSGYTDQNGTYHPHFNKGLDIGVPVGTPIDATVGGVVVGAGRMGDGWGISIKVQDANGYVHNYGHLDGVNVEVGDTVSAGQFIGTSGDSADAMADGRVTSTGPHLSYDVADPSGNWVDPSPWVNGGGMAAEMLPFDEATYLQKYQRWSVLGYQIDNPQYDPITLKPIPVDPALVEEFSKLELELSEYDRIKTEGGGSLDDDLARAGYYNQNNPAMIDAQNSANAWARQQQVNQQALTGTANEMGEQRLTQDSANAEGAAYRSASYFTAPLGFRVGSTDLPTQEEVFAKQLDMASKNLPEVKPIPYSAPLPTTRTGATPYKAPGLPRMGEPGFVTPPGFGGPGYEVEGDIVDKPRTTGADIASGASVFRNMQAGPAPHPVVGAWPTGSANSIPTPQVPANPLLTRLQDFSPPKYGSGPTPLQTSAVNAGRRFIGSLFGRN